MDADFNERLQSILSNPEAMSRIASIANGMSSQSNSAPPSRPADSEPSITGFDRGEGSMDSEHPFAERDNAGSAFSALTQATPSALSAERDPRVALLYSLKPLLREEKREKIDTLARVLAVVSMVKNTRK